MWVVVFLLFNCVFVGEVFLNMDVYLGNNIFIVKLNELYIDLDGDFLIYMVILFNFDGVIVEEDVGKLKFIVF